MIPNLVAVVLFALVLVDIRSLVTGVSELRSITGVYVEVYRFFFTVLFFLTRFVPPMPVG